MIWPCSLTMTPLPSDVEPSGSDAWISTSDGWIVRYTIDAMAGAAVVVVGPVVVGTACSESDDTNPSTIA